MLIVGLGNPGKKYEKTRHNAGFILIDQIAHVLGVSFSLNSKLESLVSINKNEDGDLTILVKPQTFMNDSGRAVSKAMAFYKSEPAQLIVVHDDVDLKPLETRKSFDASSGGHHGVEDIIEKLGSKAFHRFRIGVGRPSQNSLNVERYVLEDFSDEELTKLRSYSNLLQGNSLSF